MLVKFLPIQSYIFLCKACPSSLDFQSMSTKDFFPLYQPLLKVYCTVRYYSQFISVYQLAENIPDQLWYYDDKLVDGTPPSQFDFHPELVRYSRSAHYYTFCLFICTFDCPHLLLSDTNPPQRGHGHLSRNCQPLFVYNGCVPTALPSFNYILPTTLYSLLTTKNRGLWCVATCLSAIILQSLTIHICCLLTNNRSSSVLCWTLQFECSCHGQPVSDNQFLQLSTLSIPFPSTQSPIYSSSPAVLTCLLKYSAIHIITCASSNLTSLSSTSLKTLVSFSALPV